MLKKGIKLCKDQTSRIMKILEEKRNNGDWEKGEDEYYYLNIIEKYAELEKFIRERLEKNAGIVDI